MATSDEGDWYPGCLWEGPDFQIKKELEVDSEYSCKHCHTHKEVFVHTNWTDKICICPRVVIAYNEAGHASTGICLDCVLEAAKTIDEQ